MPRFALVQMTVSNQLDRNLSRMEDFVREAKKKGAELIAFPEMAYFLGAETPSKEVSAKYKSLLQLFGQWATRYQMEILPGTLREPMDADRSYNTLPYLDRSGTVVGTYRKIFLFQANLPDKKYDETQDFIAGNSICVLSRPWGHAGLAICFDLRFPEVFRSLKKRGAQVVFVPSAFTATTGAHHWHVLTRCRAIENQIFILAPAQVGINGKNNETFGRSLVVSPWGDVTIDMGKEEGVCTVDLDLSEIDQSAKRVSSWQCRREDLFTIA